MAHAVDPTKEKLKLRPAGKSKTSKRSSAPLTLKMSDLIS
jgi:hypothetical protein